MESTTAYTRMEPNVSPSNISTVSRDRISLDDMTHSVDGISTGYSATPEIHSTWQGIPEEPEDTEVTTQNKPAWYWKFMGWSIEIFSLLGSFCIVAAIAGLLKFYDGKAMSNTPSRPSLNTIISILSAALTALITGATTAGKTLKYVFSISGINLDLAISQSKWSWYKKPKPLADLDIVDGVSRGARGALLALFHPHLG